MPRPHMHQWMRVNDGLLHKCWGAAVWGQGDYPDYSDLASLQPQSWDTHFKLPFAIINTNKSKHITKYKTIWWKQQEGIKEGKWLPMAADGSISLRDLWYWQPQHHLAILVMLPPTDPGSRRKPHWHSTNKACGRTICPLNPCIHLKNRRPHA